MLDDDDNSKTTELVETENIHQKVTQYVQFTVFEQKQAQIFKLLGHSAASIYSPFLKHDLFL